MKLTRSVSLKLALALCVITGATAIITLAFQVPLMMGDYRDLQMKRAQEDLGRARDRIEAEIESLGSMASDWANWDDTYRYARGENPEFPKVNLTDSFFETTNAQYICILDKADRIQHERTKTPDGTFMNRPNGFVMTTKSQMEHANQHKSGPMEIVERGLVATTSGPMIYVARPILTSDKSGPPAGTLILGRYLTPSLVSKMSRQTYVSFTLRMLKPNQVQTDGVVTEGATSHVPYVGLKDFTSKDNNTIVRLTSKTQADILKRGQEATGLTIIALVILSIVAATASIFACLVLVVRPLGKLAHGLDKFSLRNGETVHQDLLDRRDEIGDVANAFSDMVKRMEIYQQKLLKSSRDSGMAQVAKGILHNAGNVMNSISVGAGRLKQEGQPKATESLRKAQGLLQEIAAAPDLEACRPKITKLADYLGAVADESGEWLARHRAELEDLETAVSTMANVIGAHHIISTNDLFCIEVDAIRAVEDVVRALRPSADADLIEIIVEGQSSEVISIDESRFAQVLTNLISNAFHAVKQQNPLRREIRITVQVEGPDLIVKVRDQGTGIEPELATRIFENGFSTKGAQRGFGLHYCAVTAMEMGGQLTLQSEGPGKGAEFTLRIPKNSTARETALAA